MTQQEDIYFMEVVPLLALEHSSKRLHATLPDAKPSVYHRIVNSEHGLTGTILHVQAYVSDIEPSPKPITSAA
jgi:hypothetical protein